MSRTLILEDYPEQNLEFLEQENIKFFQFGIPGNKVSLRWRHLSLVTDLRFACRNLSCKVSTCEMKETEDHG